MRRWGGGGRIRRNKRWRRGRRWQEQAAVEPICFANLNWFTGERGREVGGEGATTTGYYWLPADL